MSTPPDTGAKNSQDLLYIIYESLNRSPFPILIGESQDSSLDRIVAIYANSNFCKLTGVDQNAIVNNEIFSVLCNFIDERRISGIKQKLQSTGEAREEVWFTSPGSDNRKYLQLTVSRLESTQSELTHYCIYLKDFSEKKALEEKLIANHRASTLALMINGFAHDLNNLLSPVINTLDYLGSLEKFQNEKKYFKTALNSANQASLLIDKMLTLSHGSETEKKPVDLRNIIKELSQILKHTLSKDINITTEMPPVLSRIDADEILIYQVLLNMCLNSADAMPDGGDLRINIEETDSSPSLKTIIPDLQPGRYVKITVSDTGTGIPDNKIQRIFEPFFSLSESKMGLGLFTCKEIINDHNGYIAVDTKAGKGTRFDLLFPVSNGTHQEIEQEVETEETNHFLKYCGNGETILLVDDEEAVKQTVGMILNKCNYNVITASDGAEAIRKYIENMQDIKLVILDIVMPVMDGITAAKALKNYNDDLKIILSTGYEGHKKVDDASKVIDRFIRKPYSSVDLLELVSDLMK